MGISVRPKSVSVGLLATGKLGKEWQDLNRGLKRLSTWHGGKIARWPHENKQGNLCWASSWHLSHVESQEGIHAATAGRGELWTRLESTWDER
jgi:hypothetical protein